MSTSMLLRMVLHKLAESPQSGYSLCKAIEDCTGRRPSYGSIYPLLEKLTQQRMVTVKKAGRKKIYTITKQGKEHVKTFNEQRAQLVDNLSVQIKALMDMAGQNPDPIVSMLGRMKQGKSPLGSITKNMFEFRDQVFGMVERGVAEKHKKEINTMLVTMRKRLEKMQ